MSGKWTRDPLVHFLIAGGLLFALFAWRGEDVAPDSRTITVSREVQAGLALQFERTLQRPPTDAELAGRIEGWVRDEVLYREGLRLGLDSDDAVVRRRLAKKMDGLASAQAELATPSDATLQSWFKDNQARFVTGARYSFAQRYFESEAAASAALGRIAQGALAADEGEAIALPASMTDRSRSDIEKQFGRQFAAGLAQLKSGDAWQGPIVSGFGWHLVQLQSAEGGAVPVFADVRDRAEDEWRIATIDARRQQAYQLLREAYDVDIAE